MNISQMPPVKPVVSHCKTKITIFAKTTAEDILSTPGSRIRKMELLPDQTIPSVFDALLEKLPIVVNLGC